jgi:DNA-binding MarR family transcriptional regulator
MESNYSPTKEQRQNWIAFIQAIHPDLDARAIRLMDEMRLVAHAVHQLNEMSLAHCGLSPAQFRVLMILLFCEHSGATDGLNPSEISHYQGTSRNTISSLIRGLEEGGLIERHLDASDRRKFNIRLTEAGRNLVMNQGEIYMQAAGEIFKALDAEEMELLSQLLHKLNRQATAIRQRSCPNENDR